ncbi:hypothetical protein G7077_09145 [Sphingomonas piscis]|uniref:Sugar transporter n=1 Tax=Sphingomonas piscis TaxID=2714943 RepID=A0A6G7YQL8_9SPHN|nr:hypothetical protein [Sphingomonas piscis]QIK79033.1 hypothetical protein G7077_09145 [Sphingomonas piscis]
MASRISTPWHLWLVGGLATLWNGFGCFDYTMTNVRGTEYIGSMMPGLDAEAMMAWINAFPAWVHAGWAVGVWFGLIGSILLLARSRFALPALIASLVGAVVTFIYQFTSAPEAPQGADGGAMPLAIIAIAVALVAYAAQMKKRGVLR